MTISLLRAFSSLSFLTSAQTTTSDATNNGVYPIHLSINPFQHLNSLRQQAIVTNTIRPGKSGRIRFQGSWWPAQCLETVTLRPGDVVVVVGRRNITLMVERLEQGPGLSQAA